MFAGAAARASFEHLRELIRGDEISVTREDRSVAVFRVTRVERFPKDEFPTHRVYGGIEHAGLRLITCAGLDRKTRRYVDNVVVFAKLVRANQR